MAGDQRTDHEADPPAEGQPRGLRARLAAPLSLRSFLLAFAATGAGALGAVVVPLIPAAITTLGGIFAAGFALGVGRGTRAYLAVAVAGACTAAVAIASRYLVVSVIGDIGVPIAAVGAGAGLFVAVLGHYFGRDLRAGLTKPL